MTPKFTPDQSVLSVHDLEILSTMIPYMRIHHNGSIVDFSAKGMIRFYSESTAGTHLVLVLEFDHTKSHDYMYSYKIVDGEVTDEKDLFWSSATAHISEQTFDEKVWNCIENSAMYLKNRMMAMGFGV